MFCFIFKTLYAAFDIIYILL